MHALCYKMSDISSYAFVMLTHNICKLEVFAINGKYLFFKDCTLGWKCLVVNSFLNIPEWPSEELQ